MYSYETAIVWQNAKEGSIHAAGAPEIRVATPPEFGGPTGIWSPEQLFVASIGSCLMNTFLFFAERSAIRVRRYSSTAIGQMEKTPDGLRFTAIDVTMTVEVDEQSGSAKALRLQSKLEKYCPISTSVKCPVKLFLKATVREDHHEQVPGAGNSDGRG